MLNNQENNETRIDKPQSFGPVALMNFHSGLQKAKQGNLTDDFLKENNVAKKLKTLDHNDEKIKNLSRIHLMVIGLKNKWISQKDLCSQILTSVVSKYNNAITKKNKCEEFVKSFKINSDVVKNSLKNIFNIIDNKAKGQEIKSHEAFRADPTIMESIWEFIKQVVTLGLYEHRFKAGHALKHNVEQAVNSFVDHYTQSSEQKQEIVMAPGA